jgi:hypothetical protein
MAWTSPRTTELLDQIGDLERLPDIGLVGHEPARFGGEPTPAAFALGGLCDGLPGGLCAGDASASGDFVQLVQAIRSEA